MRDRLTDLLEKADLAIASSAGVVDHADLAPLIDSVRGMRMRLAYPEDILVVALAGGTGSGKSSLFNAIAGEELVDVGGVRPTTARPAAAAPSSAAASLDGYLDRLGVEERYSLVAEGGLCLLDLPDTDSVELGNRFQVDALLPMVDVVVWVVDPEKYNDARLHHDYLRPLAAYSEQFVFVLNQVDRLSEDQVGQVAKDLKQALSSDGIGAPRVVATSAAPPAGPPIGIDELVQALEQKREEGHALYEKLVTDLVSTTKVLSESTGRPIAFDDRAAPVLERATREVMTSEFDSAVAELTALVEEVAGEVGGPAGEKIERLAGDIPRHVLRIGAETEPEGRRRRWFARRGQKPDRDPDQVRSSLNEAILRPVRAVLAQRALAQAAVTELAVEVHSLR
jgi:GTP-binding protein EngB required for normal cell division